MITLRETVRDALAGVCGDVIFGDPRDFASGERICWRESKNRRHAQADGAEYLAEVEYTLEIYAEAAEAASGLLDGADAKLCACGFRREAAAMQFEQDSGVSHITARYRALADVNGNIYQ